MVANHLKRLAAPRTWPIQRKSSVFVVKADPGPHPVERSVPLVVAVRDILQIARNTREVKYLITNGLVFVNGKKVKSYRFPIGIFDCISFPSINKYYRLTLNRKGKLVFIAIEKDEANKFVFQIRNKRLVKGGKIQLNLSAGMNIVLPSEDHSKYVVGQSLFATYPPLKIIEMLPVKEKAKVFVLSGRHRGKIANIKEVYEKGKEALLEEGGEEFRARTENFVVVGMEEPLIKLSESDENE